jgi:hypothetical protein
MARKNSTMIPQIQRTARTVDSRPMPSTAPMMQSQDDREDGCDDGVEETGEDIGRPGGGVEEDLPLVLVQLAAVTQFPQHRGQDQ